MAVPLLMRDAIVHLSSRLSIDVVCYDDGRRRRPGVRRRDRLDSGGIGMAVQVYGCNHVAIEVDDAEKAWRFIPTCSIWRCSGAARGRPGASWASTSSWPSRPLFLRLSV